MSRYHRQQAEKEYRQNMESLENQATKGQDADPTVDVNPSEVEEIANPSDQFEPAHLSEEEVRALQTPKVDYDQESKDVANAKQSGSTQPPRGAMDGGTSPMGYSDQQVSSGSSSDQQKDSNISFRGEGTDSPRAAAFIQVSNLDSALEAIEQALRFVGRFADKTLIDDHILRHVVALRKSPDLLRELQADFDALFGGGLLDFQAGRPLPSSAQRALFGGGVLKRIVDRLRALGLDLDLGTLLELLPLIFSLTGGGMTFGQLIEALIGILTSRQQAIRSLPKPPHQVSAG